MIRVPISGRALRDSFDAVAPATGRSASWLDRAEDAAAHLRARKAFEKVPGAPDWRDVISVYRGLQHHKCAYCERPLPTEDFSAREHDVEHYRPKGRCVAWPPPQWPPGTTRAHAIPFLPGCGRAAGYPELAYEPDNYAASCPTCNEALKHDHFPIAGRPSRSRTAGVRALNEAERPYLLFPIGDVDTDDPEDVIAFEGIRAIPRYVDRRSWKHRRAVLTIELFQLNERHELLRERQGVLDALFGLFKIEKTSSDQREVDYVKERIRDITSPASAHTSCARSFLALLSSHPTDAFRLLQDGQRLLGDGSPARLPP